MSVRLQLGNIDELTTEQEVGIEGAYGQLHSHGLVRGNIRLDYIKGAYGGKTRLG